MERNAGKNKNDENKNNAKCIYLCACVFLCVVCGVNLIGKCPFRYKSVS